MDYTTRVELHRGSEEDYETLHSAMEREGFSRQVKSDDGTWYHLPTAEYNYQGNESRGEVREKAKRAAAKTGLAYMVLVTESNGRTWYNLSKA